MTAKSVATREARLAAALKENLKRRKAQARAKAFAGGAGGEPTKVGAEASSDVRPKAAPKAL